MITICSSDFHLSILQTFLDPSTTQHVCRKPLQFAASVNELQLQSVTREHHVAEQRTLHILFVQTLCIEQQLKTFPQHFGLPSFLPPPPKNSSANIFQPGPPRPQKLPDPPTTSPLRGVGPVNGFIGAVSPLAGWGWGRGLSLSLTPPPPNFWVYSAGVGGCGGGGLWWWWWGVAAPTLLRVTQTSPSPPPTLLSVAVR